MPRRLVLGIDPGFASLGYAVLELGVGGAEDRVVTIGVLRTKATDKKHRVLVADDNVRRGRELARPLGTLVRKGDTDYAHKPPMGGLFEDVSTICLVCAEKMSFPRSSSAAAKVAMTWGLMIANLERYHLPLLVATPQDVKRRVTGKADASKKEVEAAMIKRFGRGLLRMVKGIPETQREHAFDALASAVACLDSEEGRMVRTLG
jgi:Holliday junction resolvasome RuvABC endonuclease subunit